MAHHTNVAALNRIIDSFGAYLSHFTALTEDSSTTPDDKQKKIKGLCDEMERK